MKLVINSDILIANGDSPKPNDDFTYEREDTSFGLSGIVLNNISEKDEIPRYIVDGSIQKRYKGSYIAWFYDKKNKKIYVANDLLSKQSVYYYNEDGLVLVNTSLFDLCADLRANGRIPHMNNEAIHYFLDNYVFCGDMTYEKHTFFLIAYSYIIIDCEEKRLEVKRLPIPRMRAKDEIKNDLIIEEMEKLFSIACDIQWRKNESNRKEQNFTLSGGMDSRALLLHMIKQNPNSTVKTYTYAQSGSSDEIIARRTAKELGMKNVFIPLDRCEFAYQRDEIIDANEGQMYYIGSTGAILMAEALNKQTVGIVHTGLGGGEILGDVCSIDGDTIYDQYSGMTVNQQKNLDDIRRCLNFQKTTSRYFYALSPFLDEDFFEYVMCLPASMRVHRRLYISWYKKYMNSNFPSAASYSLIIKAINRVKNKMYKILGKRNPADMNPIQYWYDTYPKLREYIDASWKDDSEMLSEHKDLIKILSNKFNESAENKFAVLTVTGTALRLLGINHK